MHGLRNEKLKNYIDYDSEPKLKGDELRKLINFETVWILEDFVDKELPRLNVYFKLFANLLWLEEDFETNKQDISYLCAMIGFYVGVVEHPPNGERIAISYLNKAIKYTNNDTEKGQYKYYIELAKGPDGTPELYEEYFD